MSRSRRWLVEVRQGHQRALAQESAVQGAGATSRARISRIDVAPTRTGRTTSGCATSSESGAFSLTASGPVVPETDTSTYNGKRWEIAAEHLSDARRGARAVRAGWRSSRSSVVVEEARSSQYDIFKRYDRQAKRRESAAMHDLLVIGANHILSMVDAFATIRLAGAAGARRADARRRERCAGEPNHSGCEARNCCSYHKLTSLQTPPYFGASPLTSSRREWPRQARSCTRPMASLRRMSCSGGSTPLGVPIVTVRDADTLMGACAAQPAARRRVRQLGARR